MGVNRIAWGGGVFVACTGLQRKLVLPSGKIIIYAVVSGGISFVIPNFLLFSTIPHAGAGYTGLMFALSPVFTLALALVFKMKAPSRLGVFGIGIGLVGAVIVSFTRGASVEAPPLIWIFAALLIPASLACGNIYRTLAWPETALPDVLAFWSHAFAFLTFACILLFTQGGIDFAPLAALPYVAVVQMLVAGITFPIFFRLQKLGGPVLLSQIGYVAAAVGMLVATLFLGESYGLMTWLGAGVIALGILTTILAQSRQ